MTSSDVAEDWFHHRNASRRFYTDFVRPILPKPGVKNRWPCNVPRKRATKLKNFWFRWGEESHTPWLFRPPLTLYSLFPFKCFTLRGHEMEGNCSEVSERRPPSEANFLLSIFLKNGALPLLWILFPPPLSLSLSFSFFVKYSRRWRGGTRGNCREISVFAERDVSRYFVRGRDQDCFPLRAPLANKNLGNTRTRKRGHCRSRGGFRVSNTRSTVLLSIVNEQRVPSKDCDC